MASKIGRNARCPCGSGAKYKKCCLAKDEAERRQHTAARPSRAPADELAADEVQAALRSVVSAVDAVVQGDRAHLSHACYELGLDPVAFASAGDVHLLLLYIAFGGGYLLDAWELEQEILGELCDDSFAADLYEYCAAAAPAVWHLRCDADGHVAAGHAFGPLAAHTLPVALIGPPSAWQAGERFVVGHLLHHRGVDFLLIIGLLRHELVGELTASARALLMSGDLEVPDDLWDELGPSPAQATLDPDRRMRARWRRHSWHPVLGRAPTDPGRVAQALAEWLVEAGAEGELVETARGPRLVGPVRAVVAAGTPVGLRDLAQCVEALAAEDVRWRAGGEGDPAEVTRLAEAILEQLGTDREGRVAAFDEAAALRRPVVGLLLDADHPVHAEVGGAGTIGRALEWAVRGNGGTGDQVRAAWDVYRGELRWLALGERAAYSRGTWRDYDPSIAALELVFDPRLRAMPVAALGLSNGGAGRLRRALTELGVGGPAAPPLAALPGSAQVLLGCRGFGEGTFHEVTRRMAELLGSWRERLAGVPLEPPTRGPRDEAAAQALADGLDELAGLFG